MFAVNGLMREFKTNLRHGGPGRLDTFIGRASNIYELQAVRLPDARAACDGLVIDSHRLLFFTLPRRERDRAFK